MQSVSGMGIELPHTVSVVHEGSDTLIRYNWRGFSYVFAPLQAMFAWLVLLALAVTFACQTLLTCTDHNWLEPTGVNVLLYALSLFIVSVALLVVVVRALQALFIRTSFRAGMQGIEVRTGPLPSRLHARREIRQIFVLPLQSFRHYRNEGYRLMALAADGGTQVLLPFIRTRAEAMALQAQLRRSVGLSDKHVKGAVGNEGDAGGLVVCPPNISIATTGRKTVIRRRWYRGMSYPSISPYLSFFGIAGLLVGVMYFLGVEEAVILLVPLSFVLSFLLLELLGYLIKTTIIEIDGKALRIVTEPLVLGDCQTISAAGFSQIYVREIQRKVGATNGTPIYRYVYSLFAKTGSGDDDVELLAHIPVSVEAIFLEAELEKALGLRDADVDQHDVV